MLKVILQKPMEEKGLSSHSAAEAIGVSHTTILRALRGDAVDVDTIIKIARYLKLRPSDLLDVMGDGSSLPEQISILLSSSRELEKEIGEAVERVKAGKLDVAVLRDIISYALFKMNSGETRNARTTNARNPKDRRH